MHCNQLNQEALLVPSSNHHQPPRLTLCTYTVYKERHVFTCKRSTIFKPLKAELNPIRHLLALLGAIFSTLAE
jgi:hypothetical protein